MATDDDERTVAERVKKTVLELPVAANDDDESTNVDPPTSKLRPALQVDGAKPTQLELPRAPAADDDATQARPPPELKLARLPPPEDDADPTGAKVHTPTPRAPQRPAVKPRESTEEYVPHKRLHALVPVSIVIGLLLLLLLAVGWLRHASSPDGEGDGEPQGLHRLFSW